MKKIILTAGMLALSGVALAKGSETILDNDPHGIYVTIISIAVVLSSLIGLFFLIWLFAKVMVRSARKKAAKVKSKSAILNDALIPPGCDSVENGEIVAAISLAIKLCQHEMHDHESDVITINKVARVYSPWSSKIHGLTQMPERIRK